MRVDVAEGRRGAVSSVGGEGGGRLTRGREKRKASRISGGWQKRVRAKDIKKKNDGKSRVMRKEGDGDKNKPGDFEIGLTINLKQIMRGKKEKNTNCPRNES